MPLIKRSLRAAGLLTPLLLAACAIRQYQPGSGENAARVRLMGMGELSMCRAHLKYRLPVHEDGQGKRWTYLPVGERIELTSYSSVADGAGTAYCTASASVIPSEGITLIVNSTTPAFNSCGLEVVREDESSETGLSVEPSLQPSPQLRPRQPPILKDPSSC